MDSSKDTTIHEIQLRLMRKNINIIHARGGYERRLRETFGGVEEDDRPCAYVIAEYSFEKPDGRVIWPKLAASGDSLNDAILNAEEYIDYIRSEA